MKKFFIYTLCVFVGLILLIQLIVVLSDDEKDVLKRAFASKYSLKEYASEDEKWRLTIIDAYIKKNKWDKKENQKYLNCMGSMAYEKSPELLFKEVLGWCHNSYLRDKKEFNSYFNELDRPKLQTQSDIICNNYVQERLKSPATADFPTFPKTQFYAKRNKYIITSYVDSQNSFGAMMRTQYYCEIEYVKGEPLHPDSWSLINIEMY